MMKIALFAAVAPVLGIAAAVTPAHAQDADGERVNQVIVYGDQPCPEATDDKEIIVCVRQEDPYRIPTDLRQSEDKANESWASRVEANADVGKTGVGSCNNVGAAGQSGCSLNEIDRAYAEKRNSDTVRMGQLIAEERARRLETIDADADAEQQRVEAYEDEYRARQQEAGAAPAPATATTAAPAGDAEVVAGEGE